MAAPTPQQVAAWRKRVHGARRRAILTVLTIVRLKQGRNHPARLQRVDSFSYCIPLALNTDYPRFVEEQARHLAISVDVQGCKVRARGFIWALGPRLVGLRCCFIRSVTKCVVASHCLLAALPWRPRFVPRRVLSPAFFMHGWPAGRGDQQSTGN